MWSMSSKLLCERCQLWQNLQRLLQPAVPVQKFPNDASSVVPTTVLPLSEDSMLKSTLVVAYLQERGDFPVIVEETRLSEDRVAAFEKALGATPPEFEEEWKHWLLGDEPDGSAERRVVALGCRDGVRAGLWLELLLRSFAGVDRRPVRYPRVHPDEVDFELLRGAGLREEERAVGYAADAVAA